MTASTPRLVADVGGTNTRLALFDPAGNAFHALTTYVNRDYAGLEDILSQWLADRQGAAPDACCLAVAAPLSGDRVEMSNIDWSFSCRELVDRFGFRRFRRLNDFEANAYALPHLSEAELQVLYPGVEDQTGHLATVGPGTGLGGAFLARDGGACLSFACEPGHMGLSPASDLELDIFRLMLRRHRDVYAELLVSGPGLARLHQALAELRGEPAPQLEPAAISRRALVDREPLSLQALEVFCALFGSACGDFLLATGSFGGLFLAGNIAGRIGSFLPQSDFHTRLVGKGAMRDKLAAVPVRLITAAQPGLIGAAHAPL